MVFRLLISSIRARCYRTRSLCLSRGYPRDAARRGLRCSPCSAGESRRRSRTFADSPGTQGAPLSRPRTTLSPQTVDCRVSRSPRPCSSSADTPANRSALPPAALSHGPGSGQPASLGPGGASPDCRRALDLAPSPASVGAETHPGPACVCTSRRGAAGGRARTGCASRTRQPIPHRDAGSAGVGRFQASCGGGGIHSATLEVVHTSRRPPRPASSSADVAGPSSHSAAGVAAPQFADAGGISLTLSTSAKVLPWPTRPAALG